MTASGFTEESEVVPGRTPPWVRGEPPNIAEAANAKMHREIA